MQEKNSVARKRGGRPRALEPGDQNTYREIHKLAALMCTQQEAAAFLGCGLSTFTRFLTQDPGAGVAWEAGLAEARVSLRRKQFKLAEKSAAMAIFLGKQYLQQRDHIDQRMYVKRIEEMTIEELEWLLGEQQGVLDRFEVNFGRKMPTSTEQRG